ncbi:MAG TPA: hypothetical protein VGC79_16465, partial [Polyangiaceae bacterium]
MARAHSLRITEDRPGNGAQDDGIRVNSQMTDPARLDAHAVPVVLHEWNEQHHVHEWQSDHMQCGHD